MSSYPIKTKGQIHVMIVDDSAVVRQVAQAILSQERDMVTSTASDPLFALEKMKQGMPDVILLDIDMPRMDGLTFLRKLMAESPVPVVICSALATERAELGLRALTEGAVAVIGKPKIGLRDFLTDSAKLLIDTIREASQTRIKFRANPRPLTEIQSRTNPTKENIPRVATKKIVALGSSTGGPEALRDILTAMPAVAPGIVIVQHIPKVFSAALAKHLNQSCTIEVKEAEHGDLVTSGRALIAPGDRHMTVRRLGTNLVIELADGPTVSRHRPSIDVLFRSVAEAAGVNSLGVILTGMGDDGADGLFAMRQAGASTAAQDEASSVVFGMPKEAIDRGGAKEVLPLSKIALAILKWAL